MSAKPLQNDCPCHGPGPEPGRTARTGDRGPASNHPGGVRPLRDMEVIPEGGKGGLTGTVMGSFLIAHPRGTNWERYRDVSKGSSDGNQKQDLRSQCLHFPEKL